MLQSCISLRTEPVAASRRYSPPRGTWPSHSWKPRESPGDRCRHPGPRPPIWSPPWPRPGGAKRPDTCQGAPPWAPTRLLVLRKVLLYDLRFSFCLTSVAVFMAASFSATSFDSLAMPSVREGVSKSPAPGGSSPLRAAPPCPPSRSSTDRALVAEDLLGGHLRSLLERIGDHLLDPATTLT